MIPRIDTPGRYLGSYFQGGEYAIGGLPCKRYEVADGLPEGTYVDGRLSMSYTILENLESTELDWALRETTFFGWNLYTAGLWWLDNMETPEFSSATWYVMRRLVDQDTELHFFRALPPTLEHFRYMMLEIEDPGETLNLLSPNEKVLCLAAPAGTYENLGPWAPQVAADYVVTTLPEMHIYPNSLREAYTKEGILDHLHDLVEEDVDGDCYEEIPSRDPGVVDHNEYLYMIPDWSDWEEPSLERLAEQIIEEWKND